MYCDHELCETPEDEPVALVLYKGSQACLTCFLRWEVRADELTVQEIEEALL
jgi:hypothetical protein